MFPWLEFFQIIAVKIFGFILEPAFWLLLGLVAYQYHRLGQDQKRMFGVSGFKLREQVALAAFYGLLGGIIGSFILGFAGVTINQLGLEYIWPVAIALLFINMRFVCFAYAGGLVALSSALFGWPEINVPQVLALVAGLHVTESILIFISGRFSTFPLILGLPDGRLAGAFSLQNFWPLPLAMLAVTSVPPASLPAGILDMPDWWPLLPAGQPLPEGETWLYGLFPVVAALGYADIAVATSPAVRRRRSAVQLALYSIVLLALALLSAKYTWLQAVAAVVSPLGHELLIQLDNRRETGGVPLFVPPLRGVMVLDTVAGSPARKLGLRPGDIIVDIAGMEVNSGYQLAGALSFAPARFSLSLVRDGQTLVREAGFRDGERRLGVIIVPEGAGHNYATLAGNRFGLYDVLRRRWRRWRGGK